ncbi:MAG: hypothetical protein ACOYK8_08735 [Alphaproteobacteria bacterium]
MFPFGNDNPQKEAEKQQRGPMRQAMRYAFNPDIGRSFSILKEAFGGIIQTFAQLLYYVQLIDQNHPTLTGQDRSFNGLIQALNQASKRVKYDRDHVPQAAVFLGIISIFASVIFGLLWIILTFH